MDGRRRPFRLTGTARRRLGVLGVAVCLAAVAALGPGAEALPGTSPSATASASGGTTRTADQQLVVDLSDATGSFRGGASGVLYGVYDEGVPSDALIAGMGVTTVNTKAQDGQQHPGSDALEVVGPVVEATDADVYVYMTDYYRNFPYERTSYAEYAEQVTEQVTQALTSEYHDHIVWVPYNEPDGNWFSGMAGDAATATAFVEEWKDTYDLIRGIDPDARIAGPNLTWYYETPLRIFLTYCAANGCLPDVMTWHELGVPSTVRSSVAAYRALEAGLGVEALPVNLNEYSSRSDLTNPAEMVAWLAALEETGVDGNLPYWNVNGTLGDSTSQQNVPNAQWWLYEWYSGMTGENVTVTPSTGNADHSLQGLATLDPSSRTATVLLGGGAPATTDVVLQGVDEDVFGSTVHVTVERDRWSGILGAAATPERIADTEVEVSTDGTVTVPVDDTTDTGRDAGCDVTVRVAGASGQGQELCGAGEYLDLPDGLVADLDAITLSAWVNPDDTDTWSRVFDLGSSTTSNMFLTVNAGTAPRFAITTGGAGAEQQLSATEPLAAGTWSHVAVTIADGVGTLYVDGEAVATNTSMTLTPADLGATTNNWIGRSQYSDPYLDGTVDDVEIYSTALDADAVAALAAGGEGAGDVLDLDFEQGDGTTVTDTSGSGNDATVVPAADAVATSAYRVTVQPGGSGSASPVDASGTTSYEAEDAQLGGSAAVSTTAPTDTWTLASSNDGWVTGFTTGSDATATFTVDAPAAGDYDLTTYAYTYAGDTGVDGPTTLYVAVDGADPVPVEVPVSYETLGWTTTDTGIALTAGEHTLTYSTTGTDGAATTGTASLDKIDLGLADADTSVLYQAEQAVLDGATTDFTDREQSGAGTAVLGDGGSATFRVSADADGYADLVLRHDGDVTLAVGDSELTATAGSDGSWSTSAARVLLPAGISQVTVTGSSGAVLDDLAVTPVDGADGLVTYQAEDGTLTGDATTATDRDQAVGAVVTGITGGDASTLTLDVTAEQAGEHVLLVRYANDQELTSNHYNPDLMAAPLDVSVDGADPVHVNLASTFAPDAFRTVAVTVDLVAGTNTLTLAAHPQYDWDGSTIGVVTSGDGGVGEPLKSQTAPDLDSVTVGALQL